MNCLECQDLLQKRLDGEASAGADALEQHLNQCPACREQQVAALRLLDGLKSMAKPQPAPDFAATMTATVLRDRRHRHEKMRRRVVLTVALAASVMFMLVIAYSWMPRTPTDDLGVIARRLGHAVGQGGQGIARLLRLRRRRLFRRRGRRLLRLIPGDLRLVVGWRARHPGVGNHQHEHHRGRQRDCQQIGRAHV